MACNQDCNQGRACTCATSMSTPNVWRFAIAGCLLVWVLIWGVMGVVL